MAKQDLSAQLDQALNAMLSHPERQLAIGTPELEPLLRVAKSLRGLPTTEFKATLKSDLIRSAKMTATGVKPIREGFHSITPYLIVPGMAQLIDFLKEAYGATEIFRVQRPGTALIMHAEVRIGDSMLEMADSNDQFPPTPAVLHLYVENVDEVLQRAVKAGATSPIGPVDQPYGDREAGVKDPCGNQWYVATHKGAHYIPEGLRSITPYLHPRGAAKMVDFLKEAFAAEEVMRENAPDGSILHAKVKIGDSIIEMGDAHGEYEPMPCTLHLYVPDADAVYARALKAGATSIQPVADQPYGDRSGGVKDPFGNRWFIATHMKDIAF